MNLFKLVPKRVKKSYSSPRESENNPPNKDSGLIEQVRERDHGRQVTEKEHSETHTVSSVSPPLFSQALIIVQNLKPDTPHLHIGT